jgi:CRP/FNR family transcriptional regulator, cyclic AMP receptor protein
MGNGEFRSLVPPQAWADLLRRGSPRRVPPGTVLIDQGQPGSDVVILVSGRVKVTHLEADGTELLLAIRAEGALLGEMAELLDGRRSATVTALTSCSVHVLASLAFWECVRAHDLGRPLLRHVAALLVEGNEIRSELGMTVSQRLSRLLVRLCDRIGTPCGATTVLQLSMPQEDLARAIGSSRSMLAVELSRLRSLGIIQTSRREIIVMDPVRLRMLATRRADGSTVQYWTERPDHSP